MHLMHFFECYRHVNFKMLFFVFRRDLSEVSYLEGKELHQANSHLSKQDKFSLSFKDDM